MPRLPLALLLLAACSEYNLGEEKDNPEILDDTAEPECPPQIPDCQDTADTSTSDDTGETATRCEDLYVGPQNLAVEESCEVLPETGSFTPVVEWSISSFSTEPTYDQVMMTPIVASITDDNGDGDIDEDDTPDVLFTTYTGGAWFNAGVLRAVHGDGSGEIFSVTARLEGSAGLAAGDIDGDGVVEIIGLTENHEVIAFEHDGTEKWRTATFNQNVLAYAPYPAISDMNSDGSPEIVIGTVVLNSDGSVRSPGNSVSLGSAGTFSALSFPVDLDGDGVEEIITGNAAFDIDGNEVWRASVPDGYPAVGDFDGDGEGEVVATASGRVWLLDTDGAILWQRSLPNSSITAGPPTIADYDGDGEPEVGVAGISLYAVFDTDGTLLWWNPSQDGSSGVTGSAVFDFEGDGQAEVVYPDETRVWVFSGTDGAVKLESPDHSSWTVTEYAPVVDVDGDGEAEIVVPNSMHPSYPQTARAGITVLGDADGTWRPGRKIWNQHAYSITNVNDDGTIPATADLNWATHNSFRSGDLSAVDGGGSWPDLLGRVVEVCEERCSEGVIEVWVQLGNQGVEDIEPGSIFHLSALTPDGEVPLVAEVAPTDVASGSWQEGVHLIIEGVGDLDIRDLELVVDPDDDLSECDEDNNIARWGQGVCLF